jgi:predicted ABC-type ATPase
MDRDAILAALDARPIVVALAGPNGAGKSTFYSTFLSESGLRFVNADDLGRYLGVDAYAAAELARATRLELVRQRESFVFETVFSDPVGEKLGFLQSIASAGYSVVLCFIGLSSPELSDERVAMRVSQGGHDVPVEKIAPRYHRSLTNLKAAIRALPIVFAFDNSDLRAPYRRVAEFQRGTAEFLSKPTPEWLRSLL